MGMGDGLMLIATRQQRTMMMTMTTATTMTGRMAVVRVEMHAGRG